jgi:phosphatidate phosphatase APP1
LTLAMTFSGKWSGAIKRTLAVFARPVHEAQGARGLVVQPYRGYGSGREVFLIGRVFWQSENSPTGQWGELVTHLRDIRRRIARRAAPDVPVTARFCGAEATFPTDRDGYFRVHLSLPQPPPPDRSWFTMDLAVEQPHAIQAQAQIFIPPASCRYVVISDIDDTVMQTGVANKLKMLWRLFVEDAESRIAFPGVAGLYRALHRGVSGDQQNPMLYVSRAPWGIYEVLEEFFTLHGIPVGPILFLREWGLAWTSPLPRKAEDHKRELIQNMLELYSELPFVLIGDSGQHDPEIYREIVEENPGRVLAVYIRNVSSSPKRTKDIQDLAEVVTKAGSSLVLAADTVAMAEHAARLGLIALETVADVKSENVRPQSDVVRVETAPSNGTGGTASLADLRDLIETGAESTPPSLVVEPKAQRE